MEIKEEWKPLLSRKQCVAWQASLLKTCLSDLGEKANLAIVARLDVPPVQHRREDRVHVTMTKASLPDELVFQVSTGSLLIWQTFIHSLLWANQLIQPEQHTQRDTCKTPKVKWSEKSKSNFWVLRRREFCPSHRCHQTDFKQEMIMSWVLTKERTLASGDGRKGCFGWKSILRKVCGCRSLCPLVPVSYGSCLGKEGWFTLAIM